MGDNNNKDSGLPSVFVQVLAWLGLLLLYITDKLYRMVEPPLGDMWYAILTGVGVFGRGFEAVVKLWLKK